MKNNLVVFLDRDGTINPDPGYISSLADYTFYEDTLDALSLLSKYSYKYVIITNQSGIARGYFSESDLQKIHDYIKIEFKKAGITLLDIYYCPHHPDDKCKCRKPGIEFFIQASIKHSIDLKKCYIIGDTLMDMGAGRDLGLKLILVRTGEGEKTELEINNQDGQIDFVGDNLLDCIKFIIKQENLQ